MVPAPVPVTLRPLTARDPSPARALATSALGDAPHAEPLLGAVESALVQATDEHQMIVACEADALAGFVVFGAVAGALGAGRIQLVVVHANARRQGVALALIDAACERLRERGIRFVMIELPAEPRLAAAHRLAQRAGFRQEGRIDDYARDGVALLFLRRDLGAHLSDWDAPPARL